MLNSIVAWLDIILSQPRSFSRRSQWLSIGFVVFYLHWILLCSHVNGGFPYPFLNKLPQPQVGPHPPGPLILDVQHHFALHVRPLHSIVCTADIQKHLEEK